MRQGKRDKLTKRSVDDAAPGTARYVVWDSELSGFGLRVEPNGTKSYFVRYRADGGGRRATQRFVSLGKHGVLTVDQARQMAKSMLGAVAQGDDPAQALSARRLEPTVGDILDRYITEHAAHHNAHATMVEARRHVEKNIKPYLGRLRIGELGRSDVKKWHTSFSNRPYEGNRALAALRKALGLASRDWELRANNPAAGIKPFPEAKRERFFSDAELKQIGQALLDLEAQDGAALGAHRSIRILALTGMRLNEVLKLKWDWLDPEQHCARLPKAKTGPRIVPLGAPVLAYIAGLERVGPYLCPGIDQDKPLGKRQFYPTWKKVVEVAQLKNARPHDFRHTVGTYGAQTGANAFLIRDALGHKTLAMAGRYVSRLADPLKALADQVEGRIAAALDSNPNTQVLSLRKKSGQ